MKTLEDFKQEQMEDEDFKREYDEIQFIANSRAIQELEKIKEEMIKIKAPCGSTIEFKYSFIQILDNHISELKGENND